MDVPSLKVGPSPQFSPAPTAPRVMWLDAAKGLSILLVAFHHAQLTATSIGAGWDLFAQFNALFKPIRMPLFFLVSGALAAHSIERSWRGLLQGKVANLLYLYGLWTIITWSYYRYFYPIEGETLLGQHRSQLLTMWLIPLSGQWFLWLLSIYYVFAKIAHPFKGVGSLLLLCLMTALLAESIDHFPHYSWRNALHYAPFFIFGQWYGHQIIAWLPRHPWTVLALGLVAYASALGMVGLDHIAPGKTRNLPGFQLALSTAGLAVGLSAAILMSRYLSIARNLAFFGRFTLPIYLAHGIIMSIVAVALSTLILPAHGPIWMAPLLILISVPASLGLSAVLGGFGARWFYSFSGIRHHVQTTIAALKNLIRRPDRSA